MSVFCFTGCSAGNFAPCCAPAEKRATLGDFGNLFQDKSFMQIWTGVEYRDLLKNYKKKVPSPFFPLLTRFVTTHGLSCRMSAKAACFASLLRASTSPQKLAPRGKKRNGGTPVCLMMGHITSSATRRQTRHSMKLGSRKSCRSTVL